MLTHVHSTSGGIVTVNVGGAEDKSGEVRTFTVHESLVVHYSEFFRAALDGDRWKEGATRVVDLPVDDPDAFELYVSWLYTKRLHYGLEKDSKAEDQVKIDDCGVPVDSEDLTGIVVDANPANDHPASSLTSDDADNASTSAGLTEKPLDVASLGLAASYRLPIDAHILAMKLRDFCFADAVIDALEDEIQDATSLPGVAEINHVYEHTPSGSKLRKLLVHQVTHKADAKSLDVESIQASGCLLELSRSCLARLAQVVDKREANMISYKPRLLSTNISGCKYHQHPRDQKHLCYKHVLDLS